MTEPAFTDMNDLVEPFKRELAVPGEFATTFPNTTDDDLAGALCDAFAKAQIDGFFGRQQVDPNAETVTPALSSGGGAVCILYGAESVIRAQLRNMLTVTKYESSGSVYDVERSASVLVQELKDVQARRSQLLVTILRQIRANQSVFVSDGYLLRAFGYYPAGFYGEIGSFYGYELGGVGDFIAFGF